MGTKDSIDEFLERACKTYSPHIDPEVEGAVDRILGVVQAIRHHARTCGRGIRSQQG